MSDCDYQEFYEKMDGSFSEEENRQDEEEPVEHAKKSVTEDKEECATVKRQNNNFVQLTKPAVMTPAFESTDSDDEIIPESDDDDGDEHSEFCQGPQSSLKVVIADVLNFLSQEEKIQKQRSLQKLKSSPVKIEEPKDNEACDRSKNLKEACQEEDKHAMESPENSHKSSDFDVETKESSQPKTVDSTENDYEASDVNVETVKDTECANVVDIESKEEVFPVKTETPSLQVEEEVVSKSSQEKQPTDDNEEFCVVKKDTVKDPEEMKECDATSEKSEGKRDSIDATIDCVIKGLELSLPSMDCEDDYSDEIVSSPLMKVEKLSSKAYSKKEEQKANMMFNIPEIHVGNEVEIDDTKEDKSPQDEKTEKEPKSVEVRGGDTSSNKKKLNSKKKRNSSAVSDEKKSSAKKRKSTSNQEVDEKTTESDNPNYNSLYLEQCTSWFRRETRKSSVSTSFLENASKDDKPKKSKGRLQCSMT